MKSTKNISKILFVSYTADWTGPTNSLLLLLHYLREYYDVSVLLPKEGIFSEKLRSENINLYSLPHLTRNAIPAIIDLMHQEQVDLVYGNTLHGSSRNAFVAAKITGKKFVCHVREMGWSMSWRKIGFLRYANGVIAVSESAAQSVARYVLPSRLHVVYNGVDISYSRIDRNRFRDNLLSETGFTHNNLIVICVGHLCERKGQLYLIESFGSLVQKFPHLRLLLIGSLDRDHKYVNHIQQYIVDHQLTPYIQILGFREDVRQLLPGADLFIHTAIHEPHPRSILEAMASELPVIAFAADGVAETVVEGKTGLLVPVGNISMLSDTISRLITNRSQREQMGIEGSRLVERSFSASSTAQNVHQIIQSLN